MNGLEEQTFAQRFGILIRQKRRAKKWSQEKLAEIVFEDVDKRSRISEYERGVHEPRDEFDKIVKILGITSDEIKRAQFGETPSEDAWHSIDGEYLPAAPAILIGQDDVCNHVRQHLSSVSGQGLLLHGMGGVGKTAIITYSMLTISERNRPNCFFLNVRGFELDTKEDDQVKQALTRLIRRYSDFEGKLPEAITDLIALWKQTSRQVSDVLILDNVASQKQLDALFPIGTAPWLVTSRNRLTIKGKAFEIETLSSQHAAQLAIATCADQGFTLTAVIADRLCRSCDYLPLAIEVTASTIAVTPSLNTEEFLTRLADERKRLALAENWEEAVISRLKVSVDLLSAEHQKAWACLGLFKEGFFLDAGKAILNETDIHAVLADCERRHLISSSRLEEELSIRYYFHDLLRAIAIRIFDEQIAQNKLDIKRKFSVFYAELVQSFKTASNKIDRSKINRRILLEIENIRSAFDYSIEDQADVEAVDRIITFVESRALEQIFPLMDRLHWVKKAQETMVGKQNYLEPDIIQSVTAKLYLEEAQCLMELSRVADAEAILGNALGDIQLQNRPEWRQAFHTELGRILTTVPDRMNDALDSFSNAWDAQESYDATAQEKSNLRNNYGDLFFHLGDLPTAWDSYELALGNDIAAKNILGMSKSLGNMAKVSLGSGPINFMDSQAS